jgi:hypothetical protein
LPISLPISAKDYYDFFPPFGNYAGDIFSGLSSNGLLGNAPLPGLIITPACDLANRKVETLTYLPVIPVLSYFTTPAFLPELMQQLEGQLNVLQITGYFLSPNKFFPPDQERIDALVGKLKEMQNKDRIADKVKTAIQRALAGLRLISLVRSPLLVEASADDLSQLFAKSWPSIIERIIKNSYANDIHFLPADEQPAEWACIKSHALVMFRYPIAAPVEMFECAQDTSHKDWGAVVNRISGIIPGARNFQNQRPMKRLSLRPRFLSDLQTRFVAMHIKLGSPDFTDETVANFMKDLGVK